jgi:Replication initiator protein A
MSTLIPIWPNNERALAVTIAGTSMATVSRKVVGEVLKNATLPCSGNRSLTYSGPRLAIDDLDVLMAFVHRVRGTTTPDDDKLEWMTVTATFPDLLDTLNWPCDDFYYAKIGLSLERLSSAHLDLKEKNGRRKIRYYGKLIGSVAIVTDELDGRKRSAQISLNRNLLNLWSESLRINWHQRSELKLVLARWLQIFIVVSAASHRTYEIDDLKNMSNYAGLKADFKRSLTKAAQELQDVGWLKAFSVTQQSITFIRGDEKVLPAQAYLAIPSQLNLGWSSTIGGAS